MDDEFCLWQYQPKMLSDLLQGDAGTMHIQEIVFQFAGGLGIFLLGIKYMGEGLQKSAGDRLREILDTFTSNPFLGVLAGIMVTVLIQSSSGTTVLTVGLVNAGFMTLRQAIGVIMGANVGTTVTAFIIGLNISEYALPAMAAGAFLLFFFKHKKINAVGQTVFGFGSLFFGLELMKNGMAPLQDMAWFHQLTIDMSGDPVLGVIAGTLLTFIVQSSSATIGILQGLFSGEAIDLHAAIPVLFGDNIGTTVTALLAAIGASVAAKRAAFTHVIFNILGASFFLILLEIFTPFISFLQESFHLNPEMTIAVAHGSFNVVNLMIQFPFIGILAWVVTKLIPGKDTVIEFKPKHLDPFIIQQSASLALNQAKAEVFRMGEYAYQGLEAANAYFSTEQRKHADIAIQIEGALNHLDMEITDYLIDISNHIMSENESAAHTMLMDTVRDIERTGDQIENILELIDYKITNKIVLSDEAKKDLNNMFILVILTMKQAIGTLAHANSEEALEVLEKEEQIDKIEKEYRGRHVIRINQGTSSGSSGIVFVDILSNLERISDHAVNIAKKSTRLE